MKLHKFPIRKSVLIGVIPSFGSHDAMLQFTATSYYLSIDVYRKFAVEYFRGCDKVRVYVINIIMFSLN